MSDCASQSAKQVDWWYEIVHSAKRYIQTFARSCSSVHIYILWKRIVEEVAKSISNKSVLSGHPGHLVTPSEPGSDRNMRDQPDMCCKRRRSKSLISLVTWDWVPLEVQSERLPGVWCQERWNVQLKNKDSCLAKVLILFRSSVQEIPCNPTVFGLEI